MSGIDVPIKELQSRITEAHSSMVDQRSLNDAVSAITLIVEATDELFQVFVNERLAHQKTIRELNGNIEASKKQNEEMLKLLPPSLGDN